MESIMVKDKTYCADLKIGDFPGSPVVKIPHFHCRVCKFDQFSLCH